MAKINLNYTACLHSRSVAAKCVKCENVCDFEALKINNQNIEFYPDRCTNCLECLPVCPTNAISSPRVDVLGFISNFLDDQEDTISISATEFVPVVFDEQAILTLLILGKSCINIESIQGDIYPKLVAKIENINTYAASLGINTRAVLTDGNKTPNQELSSRRSFFNAFTSKKLISVAREINEQSKEPVECIVFGSSMMDCDELRQKILPPNREGFLSVIKNLHIDENIRVEAIFSSDKMIDDTCTNCELCYNLCPTGALSTARLKNSINFESHKCIKCALCEDVCATKSIHSLPDISLASFAKQSKRELIKFRAIGCVSCGLLFTQMNDEIICPRCSKEDDDAMELSGLFENQPQRD